MPSRCSSCSWPFSWTHAQVTEADAAFGSVCWMTLPAAGPPLPPDPALSCCLAPTALCTPSTPSCRTYSRSCRVQSLQAATTCRLHSKSLQRCRRRRTRCPWKQMQPRCPPQRQSLPCTSLPCPRSQLRLRLMRGRLLQHRLRRRARRRLPFPRQSPRTLHRLLSLLQRHLNKLRRSRHQARQLPP